MELRRSVIPVVVMGAVLAVAVLARLLKVAARRNLLKRAAKRKRRISGRRMGRGGRGGDPGGQD